MVVNTILLSDDGAHLVTSGWDGRVIMWDIATTSKVLFILLVDTLTLEPRKI